MSPLRIPNERQWPYRGGPYLDVMEAGQFLAPG
jgi:hypothetical protein